MSPNQSDLALPSFHNENGNIILGIVRTLEYEQLSDFLLTLHHTQYRGSVGFFCDDISQRTIDLFSSMGIVKSDFKEIRINVPFTGKKVNAYRVFSPIQKLWFTVASDEAKKEFAKKAFHIHQSRHFLYTEFLDANPTFNNVMLSDTRDVIFQKDPFDFPIHDSLCCFLEDPKTTIATEKHNASWIQRAFGNEVLQRIGNNPISCAGITIGSSQAIYKYTSLMCSILLENKVRAIAGITGLDQGIHNYAIRSGLLGDNLALFDNENGPVMTMGLMKRSQISIDESTGFVLNADGSVCNTLHQYDRHPDLLKTLPNTILHTSHS